MRSATRYPEPIKLSLSLLAVAVVAAIGCADAKPLPPTTPAAPEAPTPPTPTALAPTAACDPTQAAISRDADARATPWSLARHLETYFPDGRVSWLMPEGKYQEYVVKPGATKWGRCNATACYLFAAPAAVIHSVVAASMHDGHHDPAVIAKALGLPAANFEGPLRMMALDIDDAGACVRLPVAEDPGAWKCQTPADKDCFQFGGFTSGGVPELMVLNAPVERTAIEQVP